MEEDEHIREIKILTPFKIEPDSLSQIDERVQDKLS